MLRWLLALTFLLGGFGSSGAITVRRPDPAKDTRRSHSVNVPDPSRLGPQFPHLLIAPGPNAGRGASRTVSTNAEVLAGDALPPSILPAPLRERARRMLRARSPEEFAREQRATLGGSGPWTARVCVLRIDFSSDTPGSKTTGDGHFDLGRDGEKKSLVDPAPHDKKYFDAQMEALRRYYDVMSGGWLKIEWDVWPAENDSAYHVGDTFRYGPWIFSNSNPDIFQHAIDLVGDAIAVADSSSPEIDFKQYNSFILWHAGSDFQSDLNQDSPWDIPSFNLGVLEPFTVMEGADTVGVNLVMVVPETSAQDGFESALNSVVAHEFGHQLGFWDLYDVATGIPIVGAYSLMDSGTNLYALVPDPEDTTRTIGVRGTIPPSLDPWHKALYFPPESTHLYGLNDFLAAEDDSFEVSLPPSSVTNEYLYLPINLAEYYLIENRRVDLNGDRTLILKSDPETGVILGPIPDSTAVGDTLASREYDYLIPGEGVLVWHVDLKAIDAGLSQPFGGLNVFFSRPGVGLMEADGIRDIGTASNEFLGGPYDPYFLGGYSRLTPNTDPSSDSNDGTPSGISLAVLDSLQFEMRLKVKMQQRPGGWPVLFVGESPDQQALALNLDVEENPEVLVTSGRSILGFHANGGPIREEDEDALFINLPGDIDQPLAAAENFPFPAPRAPGAVVAAVSKGALWVMEGRFRSLQFVWPEVDSLVTSAPSIVDSLVYVGCADGVIRGFVPRNRSDAAFDSGTLAPAALRSIGVGHRGIGNYVAQFMAADGEVGALTWAPGTDPIGWRRARGSDGQGDGASIASRPAGHVFVDQDGGRHLFAWDDGEIEWRDASGSLLPGWPHRIGAPLVGSPLVTDLDRDGDLETIAVERSGRVHALDWSGHEKKGWPRSVWSEDETPFELPAGPRAFDVNGDGRPELLIHRTDGLLLAWDGSGHDVPGWPISIGSRSLHGPEWIPPGGEYHARLLVGNAYGETTDHRRVEALSTLRVPDGEASGVGFFPYPAVDLERTHVYPSAWIPTHQAAPADYVDGSFDLYPNPLRGDELQVSLVVDKTTTVDLTAFDLSGREVARMSADASPGAAGTRLGWNWGKVPPGLYQVRCRLRGDGLKRELFRKVAVLR